jgi:hypothetical protein
MEPSGGVMSRTFPAAFVELFAVELFAVEPLAAAPLVELLAGAVEPFLAAEFLAVDDFFLDAPHVDMTSYTVPTRHHPRP